jgi:hypothetical protein
MAIEAPALSGNDDARALRGVFRFYAPEDEKVSPCKKHRRGI